MSRRIPIHIKRETILNQSKYNFFLPEDQRDGCILICFMCCEKILNPLYNCPEHTNFKIGEFGHVKAYSSSLTHDNNLRLICKETCL
jgi:hypothetical protein